MELNVNVSHFVEKAAVDMNSVGKAAVDKTAVCKFAVGLA